MQRLCMTRQGEPEGGGRSQLTVLKTKSAHQRLVLPLGVSLPSYLFRVVAQRLLRTAISDFSENVITAL